MQAEETRPTRGPSQDPPGPVEEPEHEEEPRVEEEPNIEEEPESEEELLSAKDGKEDDPRETFTIKLGLGEFCTSAPLRAAFLTAVLYVTQVHVEALLLLNLYILYTCQNDITPRYPFRFFRDLVTAVTQRPGFADKHLDPLLWKVRDDLYTPERGINRDLPILDRNDRSDLTGTIALGLQTSFKNSISLNFVQRLKKWIRAKVYTYLPDLPKKDLERYTSGLLAAIARDREHDIPNCDAHAETLDGFIFITRNKYRGLLPLTEDGLKDRWHRYVPWTQHISAFLEEVYEAHTAQGQPAGGRRLKNLLFSVGPVSSFTAHHAHFSQHTFEEILRWGAKYGDLSMENDYVSRDAAALQSKEVRRGRWGEYFNLEAVETRNAKFSYYIATDGVSISVNMKRLRVDRTDEKANVLRPSWVKGDSPATLGENMRVVGIDPGVRDFVTGAVLGDSNQLSKQDRQQTIIRYSGARFHHEAHMLRSQKWRERKLKEDPVTQAIAKGLPRHKVSTVQGFLPYVRAVTRNLQQLMGHYGALQQRRRRLKVYSRRAATIQKVVKLITGGRPKDECLVGFGDASVGHNSPVPRGTKGPVKGLIRVLRRHAHVLMINEFRTSRICPSHNPDPASPQLGVCDTTTTGFKGKKPAPKGAKRGVLKKCPRCTVVWNRDTMAARNMLRCLVARAINQPRPVALQRQRQDQDPPMDALQIDLDQAAEAAEEAAVDEAV